MTWSYSAGLLQSSGATEASPDSVLAGIAIAQASNGSIAYRSGFLAWLANTEIRVATGSFIIIDDDSQIELTGSSFINPGAGGVIHGNRSTLVLSTNTNRIDGACDFETGSTLICRRERPNDPNPRIIYRHTARHDYPNIQSGSVPSKVQIAGLDLYVVNGASGYFKIYFGRATTASVSNVRIFNTNQNIGGQYYGTTYNDSYIEGLALDSEPIDNNVIFNRPNFYYASQIAISGYTRNANVVFGNPTFLNNCWNQTVNFLQTSLSLAFSMFYSYQPVVKSGLTAITGANVQFTRSRQSASGTCWWYFPNKVITGTTTASGQLATAASLFDASHVGNGSSELERYKWAMKLRVYGKRTAAENVFSDRVLFQHTTVMSSGYNEETQMIDVPNVTLTQAQAAAITGITMPPKLQARYVLLKQTGASTNNLYVGEIEVLSNGVNVAQGKTATAGYAAIGGWEVAKAVDGKNARNQDGYASSVSTSDNWVQIDLGSVMPVDSVTAHPLGKETNDDAFIRNTAVFSSENALSGFTFTQLDGGAGASTKLGTLVQSYNPQSFSVARALTLTTTAPVTTSQLWHYYLQWVAQLANFDVADTWSFDGTTLNMGAWSATGAQITGNVTTTGTIANAVTGVKVDANNAGQITVSGLSATDTAEMRKASDNSLIASRTGPGAFAVAPANIGVSVYFERKVGTALVMSTVTTPVTLASVNTDVPLFAGPQVQVANLDGIAREATLADIKTRVSQPRIQTGD